MSLEDFSYKNWDLYIKLSNEAPDQDLNSEELDDFVTLLRKLDQKGMSIIGLLIKAYETEKLESGPNGLQYETLDNGAAKFDIRNFDPKLKRILIAFCMLHLNKNQEKKHAKFKTVKIEEID